MRFSIPIASMLALAQIRSSAQDSPRNDQHSGPMVTNILSSPSTHTGDPSAKLPPPTAGVEDISFQAFFKSPIGGRGLEFSERASKLAGHKVRLSGYMVRQYEPLPGHFLLAPLPLSVNEHEYGFCDDLPASVVHVLIHENSATPVPFQSGRQTLIGTFEIGNRTEADGRVSSVRLVLDATPFRSTEPDSAQARKASNH
jgi:hypothetical protein